jgi:hypothetical protein
MLNTSIKTFIFFLIFLASYAHSADGKLLGTSGLVQIEGSGGGGLVPWATLSGLDSDSEVSVSPFVSYVSVQDYSLKSYGLSGSFYDQLEVSINRHEFEVDALSTSLKQDIYGLKYRVYGDIVYSKWPQVSVGLMHKNLRTPAIAEALGAAQTNSGTDFYISAAKVHLGLLAGYNLVWNTTLRASKANELGLLGFGGANSDDYKLNFEATAGIVLRHIAFGVEYRQKPDNLGLNEDDWMDVFVSYFPNKHISLTLAYLDLGSIAGSDKQSGYYISVGGQF